MSLIDGLKELGVNTEEGLQRMMGNTSLYERMMGTFTKLIDDYAIRPEDFDGDDCTEIIEKTHAIKGASGNLSLTPIYKAYTEIVNLLRQGNQAEAKKLYEDIVPVQRDIIRCIEENK